MVGADIIPDKEPVPNEFSISVGEAATEFAANALDNWEVPPEHLDKWVSIIEEAAFDFAHSLDTVDLDGLFDPDGLLTGDELDPSKIISFNTFGDDSPIGEARASDAFDAGFAERNSEFVGAFDRVVRSQLSDDSFDLKVFEVSLRSELGLVPKGRAVDIASHSIPTGLSGADLSDALSAGKVAAGGAVASQGADVGSEPLNVQADLKNIAVAAPSHGVA